MPNTVPSVDVRPEIIRLPRQYLVLSEIDGETYYLLSRGDHGRAWECTCPDYKQGRRCDHARRVAVLLHRGDVQLHVQGTT